jgi:hypothetical protein
MAVRCHDHRHGDARSREDLRILGVTQTECTQRLGVDREHFAQPNGKRRRELRIDPDGGHSYAARTG